MIYSLGSFFYFFYKAAVLVVLSPGPPRLSFPYFILLGGDGSIISSALDFLFAEYTTDTSFGVLGETLIENKLLWVKALE